MSYVKILMPLLFLVILSLNVNAEVLIINETFETDLTNWTGMTNGLMTINTLHKIGGSKSANISGTLYNVVSPYFINNISYPQYNLSLSVWVYSTGASFQYPDLRISNTSNLLNAYSLLLVNGSEVQVINWLDGGYAEYIANNTCIFYNDIWYKIIMNVTRIGNRDIIDNRIINNDTGAVCSVAFNTTSNLTNQEIFASIGNGCGAGCENFYDNFEVTLIEGIPPVINFSIYANDFYDNSTITNFSVKLDDTYYSTNTGILGTPLNDSSLHNITFFNMNSSNNDYYNKTYYNIPADKDFIGYLTRLYHLEIVTLNNNKTFEGINYTKNLNATLNISCPLNFPTQLILYINNIPNLTRNLSCNSNLNLNYINYTHGIEELFNISYYLNTSYNPNVNNRQTTNIEFKADLYSPNVTLSYAIPNGFVNPVMIINLTCTDNVLPNLTYNLTFNNITYFYGNETNNTLISNTTNLINGINILKTSCNDLFNTGVKNENINIQTITIYLINERFNNAFNVSGENITTARLIYDDNSTVYDFRSTNKTPIINFTSAESTKIRAEIGYLGGTVIQRFIDTSLTTTPLRVCANDYGVVHYEQLIISATEKPIFMKSVYSNCLVAADYTRFAYQDALLLKAYTINNLYYLYTFDTSLKQIFLASIDGSIATYINLDSLEFKQQGFNLNVNQEALSFQKAEGSNRTIIIFYKNNKNDNENITVTILDMNSSAIVYNNSVFANPNEFTIYFDYTTLPVDSKTVFRITVHSEKKDGSTRNLVKYFNTNAKSGVINAGIALTVSILLAIFGLTFASSRITFSWFGMFILLAAIAILSLAINNIYTLFLMAMEVIGLLYIILIMIYSKNTTIT